ncbi:MAG: YbjP/YqhG family protein [Flammeovirgaceae bacterium]|jgi:hypothetical protein|nr:YbjP/YqhG family protein [Flammeovirgaceae bacterium]
MKKLILGVLAVLNFAFVQCETRTHDRNVSDVGTVAIDDSGGRSLGGITKQDDESTKALLFLRKFYEEYLAAFNAGSTDSVKKKYCTVELLEKLNHSELSYDPFLNAQDFDDNFLKTINIRKLVDSKESFIVSYIDSYTKRDVQITLRLLEIQNEYKIDSVK